jgi:hypothetical protein
MAGIKFDVLQFYTKTFQEMNPGLAQDFNSMLYHGSIYGAEIEFAKPAILTSSLVIPELNLSNVNELVYNIPRNTTFVDNNGYNFITVSDIRISVKKDVVTATSWNKEYGTRKLTITKAPNPNYPTGYIYLIHNSDIQQYKRDFYSFDVTKYDLGTFLEFNIGIDDYTKIKKIKAWINTGDRVNLLDLYSYDTDEIKENFQPDNGNLPYDPQFEDIDVLFYKFNSTLRDNVIFLEITERSLNFETGDGIYGRILPAGSELIIEVQTTEGDKGNIPNSEFIISNVNVQEFYVNNYVRTFPTKLNGVSTTGSYGGESILSVERIRQRIFDQISYRNSIITENDYQRMFTFQETMPFVDAKFIDAKSFVFLFNVIHNNDQVVKSTSLNLLERFFLENPFYPEINYNGYTLVSPFYFKNKDSNIIEGYIVNPTVYLDMRVSADSPEINNAEDYRADVAITYDFTQRKSYIEIIAGARSTYTYKFYSNQFNADLDSTNDYKHEISTLFTDEFCILRNPLKSIRLNVYNQDDGELVACFIADDSYEQLIYKQDFYKYFIQSQAQVPTNPAAINYTLSYFDNTVADIQSTINDFFIPIEDFDSIPHVLRVPFIDRGYFYNLSNEEKFETMDLYFQNNVLRNQINYNTQLVQAFHNTIDVPEKYSKYIFERNKNGLITNPKLPIKLEVYVDHLKVMSSQYKNLTEMTIAMKIDIIKFLKKYEGFAVTYFETDLENMLYEKYEGLIKNIKVVSPQLFEVYDPNYIYGLIEENLPFEDLLDFIPPYFYFDYDNLSIEIMT